MPNSPAADISTLIVPVVTASAKVFVGVEPNIAGNIVTLYDIPGPPSNPRWQRDEPRIQVRVKGGDAYSYGVAYQLQQTIKDVILGMNRITIAGTVYVGCWQVLDISSLGSDDNNRPILISNYRLVREYTTANRSPIE